MNTVNASIGFACGSGEEDALEDREADGRKDRAREAAGARGRTGELAGWFTRDCDRGGAAAGDCAGAMGVKPGSSNASDVGMRETYPYSDPSHERDKGKCETGQAQSRRWVECCTKNRCVPGWIKNTDRDVLFAPGVSTATSAAFAAAGAAAAAPLDG